LSKSYHFLVRGVDQPYKIVGTWLVDQWKSVGLKFDQHTHPTGPFYAIQRGTKEFDVSIDANCNSVVNPLVDTAKYLSADRASNNYGQYIDRDADAIYDKMLRATDVNEQRKLMFEYNKITLDTHANQSFVLWWHRIIPHRSYVKGWKIGPSHYVNQVLDNVWLDK
jgi:peptide/nickel transport system substrate-binding protein